MKITEILELGALVIATANVIASTIVIDTALIIAILSSSLSLSSLLQAKSWVQLLPFLPQLFRNQESNRLLILCR